MSRPGDAPDGFSVEISGRLLFVARPDDARWLKQTGLDRLEGWQRRLVGARHEPGRGATAVIDSPSGPRLRLKQLRRGGAVAALWRDRFPGTRRLLDNLRIPLEALRRGVATARPVALLLRQGPRGLYRGWLALEEIEQVRDLSSRLVSGPPPSEVELGSALGAVRKMHDAGLDHRDLNLGNLLLRAGAEPRGYVIDLDGAELHDGPLGFGPRQRALRRLERSFVKLNRRRPDSDEIRNSFYSLYAAGDESLAERLERGRRAARGRIFLHGLGWRR